MKRVTAAVCVLALACFAAILVMVRMRQESFAREIDTLRRMAHAQ